MVMGRWPTLHDENRGDFLSKPEVVCSGRCRGYFTGFGEPQGWTRRARGCPSARSRGLRWKRTGGRPPSVRRTLLTLQRSMREIADANVSPTAPRAGGLGGVRESTLKDIPAPGGHVEQLTAPHVPHRGLQPLPGHSPERFDRPRDPWLMESDPQTSRTVVERVFRGEANAPGGDVARQPLEQDLPSRTLNLHRHVRAERP